MHRPFEPGGAFLLQARHMVRQQRVNRNDAGTGLGFGKGHQLAQLKAGLNDLALVGRLSLFRKCEEGGHDAAYDCCPKHQRHWINVDHRKSPLNYGL